MLTFQAIEAMTRSDGEGWGYAHARRVLKLGEHIGGDLAPVFSAFSVVQDYFSRSNPNE